MHADLERACWTQAFSVSCDHVYLDMSMHFLFARKHSCKALCPSHFQCQVKVVSSLNCFGICCWPEEGAEAYHYRWLHFL